MWVICARLACLACYHPCYRKLGASYKSDKARSRQGIKGGSELLVRCRSIQPSWPFDFVMKSPPFLLDRHRLMAFCCGAGEQGRVQGGSPGKVWSMIKRLPRVRKTHGARGAVRGRNA